jgi:SecD/SecF fusion protein
MSATFRTALVAFFTLAIPILGVSAEPQRFKVVSASLGFEARTNQPVVSFRFAPESARDFARFTEANVGRKIDVRVDGKTLSQPIVREPVTGGAGQVPVASPEDGRTLAARLSDGSAVLEMEVSKD